jgi:hypothetical protein
MRSSWMETLLCKEMVGNRYIDVGRPLVHRQRRRSQRIDTPNAAPQSSTRNRGKCNTNQRLI